MTPSVASKKSVPFSNDLPHEFLELAVRFCRTAYTDEIILARTIAKWL
jgi:hypothetical protein